MFLRAVCCSDTQGLLGFPWPLCLKRGWAKTCATLPWPVSGWSLQFVFSVLTLRSQSEGAGVKAAQHRAQRGLALTQERPEITLRRLQAGRTAAARCRPGERLPSCAHPRGLPGHGKPSTASRSAAHSPASERSLDLQSAPAWQGFGGAEPPKGAPAHASSARRERASPARAVPAPDVHRLAGPHTPTGGAVTEQRTTKTLASPYVGAYSAGVQPRLVPRRRQPERSGGHWP